jgi:hypothetical protein
MGTYAELQEEIIANRVRRGWTESATNIDKTVLGLVEEFAEYHAALRKLNIPEQIDGLGDIMVFAMGGLQILGHRIDDEVVEEVRKGGPLGNITSARWSFQVLGGLVRALKKKETQVTIDKLLYLFAVCCCELEYSYQKSARVVVEGIVEANKTRTHDGHH